MATLTSVLVLGPTGGLGKFLIAELVRRKEEFRRIGAINDTERLPNAEKIKIFEGFTSKGVDVVSGTFSDMKAFTGFDVVIMPLGNHAIKRQPLVIDTAIAVGVRHFYPSEFGADLTVPGNWEERYYRDKVVTREHLQRRSNDTAGLGYTYFINGRFTEWALVAHFGIFPKTHTPRIVGEPHREQSLLAVPDAAKYLISTLLDPLPKSPERTYRFIGGNYSWATIFEIVEKVQGVKYEVVYTDVKEARTKQQQAIETGDVDAELQASHQVSQGTGRTIVPPPYYNHRFPDVKPESLEQNFTRLFSHPEFLGGVEKLRADWRKCEKVQESMNDAENMNTE